MRDIIKNNLIKLVERYNSDTEFKMSNTYLKFCIRDEDIDRIFELMIDLMDRVKIIELDSKRMKRIDKQDCICYSGGILYIGSKFYKYSDLQKACLFVVEWLNYMGILGDTKCRDAILSYINMTKYLKRIDFPKRSNEKMCCMIYNNCFKDGNSKGEVIYSNQNTARCKIKIDQLNFRWINSSRLDMEIQEEEYIIGYNFANNRLLREGEAIAFNREVEVFKELSDMEYC